MNAIAMKDKLCLALREKSGLERQRPYLGMSGIGQCPRKLYFDMIEGRRAPSDQQHWYCWTGYLHEGGVIGLLGLDAVELRQMEIVAAFDARFRGHVDCPMKDQVVEIKSVNWDKFNRVRETGQAEPNHRDQVQMYLRHGGWESGLVVYVARDVPYREFDGPPLWVVEIEPDPVLADRLDEKAQRILAAVDARESPVCECGWCRK